MLGAFSTSQNYNATRCSHPKSDSKISEKGWGVIPKNQNPTRATVRVRVLLTLFYSKYTSCIILCLFKQQLDRFSTKKTGKRRSLRSLAARPAREEEGEVVWVASYDFPMCIETLNASRYICCAR